MSVARQSLALTGLFEAELLTELMLRFWQHPLADDREFRNDILEKAAEVLRQAVGGTAVLEDVSAANTNFVAAMWYAEWAATLELNDEFADKRRGWLTAIRRSLPGCFCNPDDLSP